MLRDRKPQNMPNAYRTTHTVIKPGDIVHVLDNNQALPRKLAVIKQIHTSHDNIPRTATIQLSNGILTTRPFKLLAPLELNSQTALEKPTNRTVA